MTVYTLGTLLINVPGRFRVLSQCLSLMPAKLVRGTAFCDMRLVGAAGHYLTNWQRVYTVIRLMAATLLLVQADRTSVRTLCSAADKRSKTSRTNMMLACIMTLLVLMALVIGMMFSGVFADEHMRKTDQLALCSRYGREVLYRAKLLAAVTLGVAATFIVGGIFCCISP